MSRAFVKEDDSAEAPVVAPRAPLPAGTPNYVTPAGLELLRTELDELKAERAKAEANRENEADRSRQLSTFNARISALNERIATARVVEPRSQPQNEVRFGATVKMKTIVGEQPGLVRTFTLVGVDEANIADGKLAFTAPIARALQGAKVGQQVTLCLGPKTETVEVLEITYT